MPKRPKGGPPPGERTPQPPQEYVAAPPEKKKVDAEFWEKFKEFQKLSPEERFAAIRQYVQGYEKSYGDENNKREVFAWLFAHPEWCRAVAIQEKWGLEHEREYGHREKHQGQSLPGRIEKAKREGKDASQYEARLKDLMAPWEEGRKQLVARIIDILEKASEGVFPSDQDLSEKYSTGYGESQILFILHQGSWQGGVYGLSAILEVGGMRDEVEQVKWLGSMDDAKMKDVLYGLHDEWEKNDLESAQKKLAEEIRKWQEGQKKGE